VKGKGSSMEKQINDYGVMTVMEFSIISKDDIKEVAKALKMTQKKVCEWIDWLCRRTQKSIYSLLQETELEDRN
jgi:predicted flap endonuclease-1-like 5' DNA nuclease